MDPGDGPEFPEPGIRLVVQGERPVTDLLQRMEVLDRSRPDQTLVIEGLNQRQDDLAVDVVLEVLVRLVADPDRLHAAVAVDAVDNPLAQTGFQTHAIDRLDVPPGGCVDEVAQIDEIVLEDVDRAQPVQGPDGIVGVADPAVAIVPVAAASGEFGHRCGHGRDDGPGLLIDAELEGDGRTDHRVLVIERDVEGADPVGPVGHRAIQRRRHTRPDLLVIAFVRPQKEGQRRLQSERPLLGNVRNRTVGRQTQDHIGTAEADVV